MTTALTIALLLIIVAVSAKSEKPEKFATLFIIFMFAAVIATNVISSATSSITAGLIASIFLVIVIAYRISETQKNAIVLTTTLGLILTSALFIGYNFELLWTSTWKTSPESYPLKRCVFATIAYLLCFAALLFISRYREGRFPNWKDAQEKRIMQKLGIGLFLGILVESFSQIITWLLLGPYEIPPTPGLILITIFTATFSVAVITEAIAATLKKRKFIF